MRLRIIDRLRDRSRAAGERGGVAVTVVAFFIGSSVILGMLAISIDLGNLTYERRQVQNGADATSLALASECAADAANCDPTKVEDLLGANSHDTVGRYRTDRYTPGVCARGTVDQVGPLDGVECVTAGDINDLAECPPLPDWLASESAIPYVETYAATQTAEGDSELFLPFSRALTGASGDAGTSACARAAWGAPDGFEGAFPLTISSCEWSAQSHDGTDFVPNGPGATGYGPGNPWPDVSKEVVLSIHKDNADVPCETWNGADFPGGFGWLETDSDCQALVNEYDWVKVNPGNGPDMSTCDTADLNVLNKVVDVPVFDCFSGDVSDTYAAPTSCPAEGAGGNNTWYHLAGWAKFYVSGLKYTGSQSASSTLPGSTNSCPGPGASGRCIIGWFLQGALSDVPSGGSLGPPKFGAYTVKPAG